MEHGKATGDRSDVKLGCWKARLVVLIKDLLSAMRRRHITQSSRTMTSHKAAAADARARHVSFAFRRMQYERRGGDRVPAYRADFRPQSSTTVVASSAIRITYRIPARRRLGWSGTGEAAATCVLRVIWIRHDTWT